MKRDKYSMERNRQLRHRFGITLDEYDTMLVKQDGVCAVCRRPEKRTMRGRVKALAVDHNHSTGEIRGLLCSDCNRAVGYLCDDPLRAESVARYLRRQP